MPIMNGASCVLDAFASVFSQIETSFEFIVVDGLSMDGTKNILELHSHLIDIIISESDTGVYDAMNKGIDVSSGEWLLFLGADDRLFDKFVLSDFVLFLRSLPKIDAEIIIGLGVTGNSVFKNSFDWRMFKNNSINHQCVFYSRNIFKRYRYDSTYKIAADYKLNLLLYLDDVSYVRFDRFVSIYGTDGISSKRIHSAMKENFRVRFEVLGLVGFFINCTRRMLDNFKITKFLQ